MHLLVLAGCAEELGSTKDAEGEREDETGGSECRAVVSPVGPATPRPPVGALIEIAYAARGDC